MNQIKEARNYNDAVNIWQLGDDLAHSIDKALDTIGMNINIEYDDTVYYGIVFATGNRVYLDNDIDSTTYDGRNISEIVPLWILRMIYYHKQFYDDFYKQANRDF